MLKSKSTKKGFTLVELLTVIAVIAIISTLSVVGYRNFTINTSKSMDKELVKQLNRAIEGESLYGEKADKVIASVIQDLFGNGIEVQSLKYGYDIYYDANLYEFCLYEQRYSQQHKSIHYYLAMNVEDPDSDEGSDELVIDFANIPKEKIYTVRVFMNLENKEKVPALFTFAENQSILSCEQQEVVDYGSYNSDKDFEIKNNSIYFHNPGVYLVMYTEDNVTDYRIFYASNKYIDDIEVKDQVSIGIDVANDIHNLHYDGSQLELTISNATYGIKITDYNFYDVQFENIDFSDYNADINRLVIIVEVNGIYKSIVFYNNKNNVQNFTFENIDIGDATEAYITYRYFGNDGIWHYSDKITVNIEK